MADPRALHRAACWRAAPGAVSSTGPDGWGLVLLPDGRALHTRPDLWRIVEAGL